MEVQIELFWAVTILIILNTIIEHLFSWWFRQWRGEELIVMLAYLYKTIIIFGLLHSLLN